MTCKCLWGSTGKVLGLWVVSAVLLTAGCVALMVGAGAGAAGTVYVMGKLQERGEASVPQVRKVTVAALEDLSFPIHQNKGDKLSAQIESETADGKAIWVKVNFVTESLSELIIRVGLTGDEQRSREILQAIKRHLS
ncbi:MAG: DUF3568 family protein [Nitrospirales bacterium]|nr:DUF3568 domain-containing protein [Nitrospirales bacterium]